MGRNGRHTTRLLLRNASVRAEVPTELIADECSYCSAVGVSPNNFSALRKQIFSRSTVDIGIEFSTPIVSRI
jgi:hypothetical protein